MSEIERIVCGSGNAFIVSEGENAVLVDTCRKAGRDTILERCLTKNIGLIVLTHGHIDHVDNAAYLSKSFDAPIAMHRNDIALTINSWAEPLSARSLLGKMIIQTSIKSFKQDSIEPFEPQAFLDDGDTLEGYGIPATIIGLPGHTKGSIGLIVNGTDVLVGDALMNILYPTKTPLYGDRKTMVESAAKISSLGNVTIHFGHGNPIKNRIW